MVVVVGRARKLLRMGWVLIGCGRSLQVMKLLLVGVVQVLGLCVRVRMLLRLQLQVWSWSRRVQWRLRW